MSIYSAYPDIADGLPEGVDINGIPSFPRAAYEVTVSWEDIDRHIGLGPHWRRHKVSDLKVKR